MSKQKLTVLMYHYVRRIVGSRYPAIKGLDVLDFEGQLDYLQQHYNVVTAKDVILAGRGSCELPNSPLLLTFDDGYKDHLDVCQRLKRRGLTGVFFPPAQAVIERKVLDVNKVHFILACASSVDLLVVEIDDAIEYFRESFVLLSTLEYREMYWKTSRFDSAAVIYIKRMLQTALPQVLRELIVSRLFAKYVSEDEAAFADELYLSSSELQEMLADGMEIGGHGYSHCWLNTLEKAQQAVEIDRSLDFLFGIGVCRDDFLFCYPYGAYNSQTVELLRERGCGAAVTTKVSLAEISPQNMLEIPRLDTNDLPRTADSIPVHWTKNSKI